jgi:tetratricopeptide (TPR) repeat protein
MSARPPKNSQSKMPTSLKQALDAYKGGAFASAAKLCESVISEDATQTDAYDLWSAIEFRCGNLKSALDLMNRGLKINPSHRALLLNRGLVLTELQQFEEAQTTYERLIAEAPNYAAAHYNLANLLRRRNQNLAAIESYERAVCLNHAYLKAYLALGECQLEEKDLEGALKSYDHALRIEPTEVKAFNAKSRIYRDQKKYQEALAAAIVALTLDNQCAEAFYNRGTVFAILNKYEDALKDLEYAISLEPNYPEAFYNRGVVLTSLMRLDEAMESYDQTIRLAPNFPTAYWNKSLLHLMRGDYTQGLPLYEWRWKLEKPTSPIRTFSEPLWLGNESLSGKTIFVHAEQGLGDTIQFSRFLPSLEALGARVIFECQGSLQELMKSLSTTIEVFPEGEPIPEFDCHCPLLSLPLALNFKLNDQVSVDRYLSTPEEKIKYWEEIVGPKKKPRIAISWSGNPRYGNDPNRSIPLSEISNIMTTKFEWISLQKEIRQEDVEILLGHNHVWHFGGKLKDFTDTAALCELADLVISVDTSVAHLSGALGRPTWIMLPFIPDWRWQLEKKDSPWYSCVRLFRQDTTRSWSAVLAQIKENLSECLSRDP